MSDAKFGFIPFVRKGLAKEITQLDATSGGTGERAEIEVTTNVKTPSSNTVTPITKTVKLVGPGDIMAISKDSILRTEPMNYVFDFEYNLLPFVEFYEEDFLWRYTPAKEAGNTGNKLRPWLALVVLKDGEFDINQPKEDGLPPYIVNQFKYKCSIRSVT